MIELYIDGKKIDQSEKISYTINREFETAADPTKMQNDYSKTIKIPITENNVAVFGDWQRADRVTVGGGVSGYYFDADAKIPFNLLNDGALVLSGYVKFSKCAYSSKDKNFEITLNSIASDWYSTIKELTAKDIDESDILQSVSTIRAFQVSNCWEHTHNFENFDSFEDVIGFSMCNNGTLKDFKNDKIIINSTENPVISINEGQQYEGWNGEYRSYYQRPYVRVDALFHYIKKVSAQYGYNVELDRSFFNINNPYYTDAILLCNLLDLSAKNVQQNKYKANGYTGSLNINTTKQLTNLVANYESVSGAIVSDALVYQSGSENFITVSGIKLKSTLSFLGTNKVQILCGSVVIAESDFIHVGTSGMQDLDGNAISQLTLKGKTINSGNIYIKVIGTDGGSYTLQNAPFVDLEFSDNVRSNSIINLERVLGSDFKPMQFVIDYCKLFGLHIITIKDTITIISRDKLFRYGEQKDITLDRSTFELEPYRFEHGFEIWGYKDSEVTYLKDYKELNNYAYGAKRIQTHYKFNNDDNTLLNTFESVLNEDAIRWYLTKPYSTTNVKAEIRYSGLNLPTFVNKSNDVWSTVEKSYALAFERSATANTDSLLWLSDDTNLEIVNSEYCYHQQRKVADPKISAIKYASAFITKDGVNYAFLFAQPNAMYINDTTNVREVVNNKINCKYLYKTFWQNYIEKDRYATDSKKLTTSAIITPTQFQNMSFGDLYNIDGVNWHINRVIDYDINSDAPTKIELVKVADKSNYYENRAFKNTTLSNNYIQFQDFKNIVSGDAQNVTFIVYSNNNLDASAFTLPNFCGFVSVEKADAIGEDAWALTLKFYTHYKIEQRGYITSNIVSGANIAEIVQNGKQAVLNVSRNNLTILALGVGYVEVESNDYTKLQVVTSGAVTATLNGSNLMIRSTSNARSTANVTINFVDGETQATQVITINITTKKVTGSRVGGQLTQINNK